MLVRLNRASSLMVIGHALGSRRFLVGQHGCGILFWTVLALTSLTEASYAQMAYTVTNLSTLAGAETQVAGINSSGQVVGYNGAGNAFVYSPASGVSYFGPQYFQPTGINDIGEVVANYLPAGTTTGEKAFTYSSATGLTNVGALFQNGGNFSEGMGINNSGQVLGYGADVTSTDPNTNYTYHAFLYTPGSAVTELPDLGGGYTYGAAINQSGEVAGFSSTSSGTYSVFTYTKGGGMVNLGTLPNATGAEAWGLNDVGQVVGDSFQASGNEAFVFSPGKGMVALGVLPGGTSSEAVGINNSGEAIGSCDLQNSSLDHAFVYTSSTGMVDLNSLLVSSNAGFTIAAAQALNNGGQIIGYEYPNGSVSFASRIAVLLTPTVSWASPQSGNWSTASNWSAPTVPAASVDADFETGSTTAYTVTLTEPSACESLSVEGDNVIIQTNGNTLSIGGSLDLSPGSTLVIENSNLSPSVVNRAIASGAQANDISSGGGINVSGTVNIGGTTFTSTEAVQVGAGETLAAANVVVQPLGLLSGNGTVNGNLSNYGTVQPGGSGSGGQLTLVGNYVQSATEPILNTPAVLTVGINGASSSGNFNALSVTGSASLAGNLFVTLGTVGGSTYLPSNADSYQILTATGTVTGQFGNGMKFVPAYSGATGSLAGAFTTEYNNYSNNSAVSNGVVLSDFRQTSPLDYFGIGVNWSNVAGAFGMRGDLADDSLKNCLQQNFPNFNSSDAITADVAATNSGTINGNVTISQDFQSFESGVGPNDTVVFYMASHGSGSGVQISIDGTLFTPTLIAQYLNNLPSTTRKVVILESCGSGVLGSELLALNNVPHLAVLSATPTTGDQDADIDPATNYGFFTESLEAAINGGDYNLSQIALDVQANSKTANASQIGQTFNIEGSGTDVFEGVSPGLSQTADYSGDLLGDSVPEPGSLTVLGCVGLFGLFRRRR